MSKPNFIKIRARADLARSWATARHSYPQIRRIMQGGVFRLGPYTCAPGAAMTITGFEIDRYISVIRAAVDAGIFTVEDTNLPGFAPSPVVGLQSAEVEAELSRLARTIKVPEPVVEPIVVADVIESVPEVVEPAVAEEVEAPAELPAEDSAVEVKKPRKKKNQD